MQFSPLHCHSGIAACLGIIVTFFGRQNHDFKGHFDMTNWTYYRLCSKVIYTYDDVVRKTKVN